MPLHLEIVTPERLAYSDEVDMVLVPGSEGELGILPHHTPLVSLLGVGELKIRKGGSEEIFAIAGGFLQVRPDKVVVMAETAEIDSDIDLERAQKARAEAEKAIEGGRPLEGTVTVSGAKNAALKLLAAACLTGERCRFENVPEIEDVRVMCEVLGDLGVVVEHPEPGVYEVAAGDVDWLFIPLEAAAKMRASFILLGPLLARLGRGIISNPGGDRIG